jgi:hypothetical protein
MNKMVDSVNQVLQDCREIETSSFYENYQNFSKLYDSLIQKGITKRRESQLRTIQDQGSFFPFSYNVTK